MNCKVDDGIELKEKKMEHDNGNLQGTITLQLIRRGMGMSRKKKLYSKNKQTQEAKLTQKQTF